MLAVPAHAAELLEAHHSPALVAGDSRQVLVGVGLWIALIPTVMPSEPAAIFGAGMQAGLQLEALALVRPIREARIWARDVAKAEALIN